MDISQYLPIWDRLTPAQQQHIHQVSVLRTVRKGEVVHRGGTCTGLLLVQSGQLRAFSLSEEGREITLYRLFDRDLCMLSASCMLRSIQFDITMEAEKETRFWVIPPEDYRTLMEQSATVANYTNELMATRFSEVMWLMEQIMWKSQDKRLAAFLLEEAAIEGTAQLQLTHETIANHLGTHREVITRMLRYFQGEGLVKLTRGRVELLDEDRLEALAH